MFCIHAVKEYGVTGDISSLIHILSSDKLSGKFQAAAAVSLEKEPPSTCIGGWVGPRACLDALGEEKICSSCQNQNIVSWFLVLYSIHNFCQCHSLTQSDA